VRNKDFDVVQNSDFEAISIEAAQAGFMTARKAAKPTAWAYSTYHRGKNAMKLIALKKSVLCTADSSLHYRDLFCIRAGQARCANGFRRMSTPVVNAHSALTSSAAAAHAVCSAPNR
jgi:hypothetical protein